MIVISYFHSFLMDMFFSESFCITYKKALKHHDKSLMSWLCLSVSFKKGCVSPTANGNNALGVSATMKYLSTRIT